MSTTAFPISDDGESQVLICPACGGTYVHVDDTYVAGRPREDGPVVPVHVDERGEVRERQGVDVPLPAHGAGRRHTISLVGWCEACNSRFALVFQQHKGQTEVSVLRQTWSEPGS